MQIKNHEKQIMKKILSSKTVFESLRGVDLSQLSFDNIFKIKVKSLTLTEAQTINSVCPDLLSLQFFSFKKEDIIQTQALQEILKKLSLKCLIINRLNDINREIKIIIQMKTLKILSIRDKRMTNLHLKYISQGLPKLEQLVIGVREILQRQRNFITQMGIQQCKKLKNLRRFGFVCNSLVNIGSQLSTKIMNVIFTDFKNLQSLSFILCDFEKIDDLLELSGMINLKTLRIETFIYQIQFRPRLFQIIPCCIENLFTAFTQPNVTTSQQKYQRLFQRCSKIKIFKNERVKMRNNDLYLLSQYSKNFEQVSIFVQNISNDSLDMFFNSSLQLLKLRIVFYQQEENIGKALLKISKLKNLKYLSLACKFLLEKWLIFMKQMKNLQEINIESFFSIGLPEIQKILIHNLKLKKIIFQVYQKSQKKQTKEQSKQIPRKYVQNHQQWY